MMLGGEEEVRSECSSGCQSGWTMYLNQSSSYEAPSSFIFKKGGLFRQEEDCKEEEEDLSMVSDASSGPPHFHGRGDQHYDSCQVSHGCRGSLCAAMAPAAALPVKGGKKRRVESGQREDSSSLLDDTASSPLCNCSETSFSGDKKGNYYMETSMEGDGDLEFSCGFSATHLKGKFGFGKQMGYVTSSVPVKPNPTRPVSRRDCGKQVR